MGRILSATLAILTLFGTARADDVGAAREHYQKGTRAYDLGHYDEAVKEYEAAYRAKDDPALLFNIAQAYRLSGDNAAAVRAYKSFLRRVPEAPNRGEVEKRIADLQKSMAEQARPKEGAAEVTPAPAEATPAPKPQPEPKPSERSSASAVGEKEAPSGRGLRIAGLSLLAIGAAGLVVGATFVALAKSANDDVNNPPNNRFDPSAEDRRDRYQTVDVVFFAIGGVAAAAGITLFLLGRRAGKRVAMSPTPGSPHAAVGFSF